MPAFIMVKLDTVFIALGIALDVLRVRMPEAVISVLLIPHGSAIVAIFSFLHKWKTWCL